MKIISLPLRLSRHLVEDVRSREDEAKRAWLAKLDVPSWGAAATALASGASEAAQMAEMTAACASGDAVACDTLSPWLFIQPQGSGSEAGWLPNFRGLVLGCIGSYDSEKRCILQGFSRSTRSGIPLHRSKLKFAVFRNINFRDFFVIVAKFW